MAPGRNHRFWSPKKMIKSYLNEIPAVFDTAEENRGAKTTAADQ
jgi:hypothetical protein